MIGPPPDAAPTLVMLHEGLGCVGLWGDFPGQAAGRDRRRRVRLFARRLRRVEHGRRCRARSTTCTTRRSTCCRAARCDRLSPRHPGRSFRRCVDRRDLCRQHQDHRVRGPGADRAAFHRRGHLGGIHRRDQDSAYETGDLQGKARALAQRRRRRLLRLERRLARSGIPRLGHLRISRLYPRAGRRSCRARTISMAPCARSRSRKRNATARSTSPLLPASATPPHREAPERALAAIADFAAAASCAPTARASAA